MNALRNILILLAILSASAFSATCDDGVEEGFEPPSSSAIGPAGGSVTSGGAEIAVPAGALDDEVTLAVGAVDAPVPLPDDVTAVGDVFSFTPHGQTFAAPVTIELPYSGDRTGLRVQILDDPSDTDWETVPSVTFDGGVATFEVEHLCYFTVTRVGAGSDAVIDVISIPGGEPDTVVVNGNNELVVFDANIDNDFGIPHLRFVEVEYDDELDEFSFELSEDELDINYDTGIRVGWMVSDRSHNLIYVLAPNDKTNDANIRWEQMQIYVVSGHERVGWFIYNPDGDLPLTAPEDFTIGVAGFAIKGSNSEGDNATRLFVHDIVGGNIEILDLDESGTALASQERFSYRERLDCDQPPDPPPWECHWHSAAGNTLALEWQLESQTPVGLPARDHLYLTDHNYSGTDIRILDIAESGPSDVRFLPDVDMRDAHDVFSNGTEGITMAGPSDTLYVATGLQSFGDGFIGTVDTATQTPGAIVLPYGDRGDILVDPSNADRVFVAVSDGFAEDPPLFVHVLEGGAVVDTFQVLERYDGGLSGMAYDPTYGLLYVVVENDIIVARID